MKRLAFLLILLLLIPSISQASPRGIFKTVASGTVTAANMKLSGVDGGATASGGAFVDFGYKYQSDFSAGVDGFDDGYGTVTGNIDSIGGEDNVLSFVCSNVNNVHYILKTVFTIGKKYTVTFRYYIPSGQSNVDGINLPSTYWGGTASTVNTLDSWTSVTKTFTASSTLLRFFASDGGVAAFQDPGGDDVFYIKDVKIEENPPTSYIGHLLKITDSAGNSIMGYIKAAMAGESLDTEVATGTLTALKLYKITATEANHFGTGKVVGSYFTSNGTETCDANNKVQCVLVGAATGVTIVSSKGGATYNWFNKNSAFNWNDASGYTYQIIKENRTTLIATSNVTAGNALMDTTTANAFAAPIGVDLTAYQDGRHLAHFTDANGRVAVGWISATAPSGFDAPTELMDDVNFDDDTKWVASSGWSVAGGKATATSATSSLGISQLNTKPNGALYLFSVVCDSITAGDYKINIDGFNTNPYSAPFFTTAGTKTGYITSLTTSSPYSTILARGTTTVSGVFDSFSMKRVTMPAATGALLLSSKGGSRGYLYKHASFNPNAALTMKILYWGD